MRAILIGIAALALIVPLLVVRYAPAPRAFLPIPPQLAAVAGKPRRVVAPDEVPAVEPLGFVAVTPEDARAWNASVPFVTGPNPAAVPFRFRGDDAQRSRATDCLAAAAWYEAGDDPVGQKAVVQVVLNRLRHPAFPKTVCGVVFQGQERTTGCQFTFTCDGALARTPSPEAWTRAQKVAGEALDGAVYKPVGYATHYHTDWVVPYWSASLDKIAEVHTHLFFRWTGWWGTPPAFRRAVSPDEPAIAKLARLSPPHRLGGALDEAQAAIAAAAPYLDVPADAIANPDAPVLASGTPRPTAGDPDTFLVLLDARAPDSFPALALRACGDRQRCKLLGWIDARLVPQAMTMTPQQFASVGFSYLRDREFGYEAPRWNCIQFKRANPRECMREREALPAATPVAKGPEPLAGVRRAGDAPASRSTPAPRIATPKLD